MLYTPGVANPFDRSLRLRKKIEQARLDFIWTDLGVILTLATIVEMESREGNRKHAERTLAKAEKGYSDMLRFFSQAKGLAAETEREFQSRFRQVRERLDGLPRPGLAFQSGVH
jgi:hypothetical protein